MLDRHLFTRRSFMGIAGATTAMFAAACSNSASTTSQEATHTNSTQSPTNELDKGHEVVNLTVNGLVDPLGIEGAPIFGWAMASGTVGARQVSYQLFVKDAAGNQV